jgi:hypothetical protein
LALTTPHLSAGEFSLTVTGHDGLTVVLDTSSDLLHWQPAATNLISGGSAYFSVVTQNQGGQFFRARQAP